MGQLDGLTDNVFKHWMDHANLKELISIDLDASDNLTEETLFTFVNAYGSQLQGNLINICVAHRDFLFKYSLPIFLQLHK